MPVAIGDVFGNLTVMDFHKVRRSNGKVETYAICNCSCGVTNKSIPKYGLTSGQYVSCGCWHKNRWLTHGYAKTRIYKTWHAMIERCTNENNPGYYRYGGRGIKVCQRWIESFENFHADVGPKPAPEYSLDRIDNDGNYEPGNVRWATKKQQARNLRTNVIITFNGLTKTEPEWEEERGWPYGIISQRMKCYGWSLEKAMTTPVKPKASSKKLYTIEGESRTLQEWSSLSGSPKSTVRRYLMSGKLPPMRLNSSSSL